MVRQWLLAIRHELKSLAEIALSDLFVDVDPIADPRVMETFLPALVWIDLLHRRISCAGGGQRREYLKFHFAPRLRRTCRGARALRATLDSTWNRMRQMIRRKIHALSLLHEANTRFGTNKYDRRYARAGES